jgi:Zn/Cd-binding protein ZinT
VLYRVILVVWNAVVFERRGWNGSVLAWTVHYQAGKRGVRFEFDSKAAGKHHIGTIHCFVQCWSYTIAGRL